MKTIRLITKVVMMLFLFSCKDNIDIEKAKEVPSEKVTSGKSPSKNNDFKVNAVPSVVPDWYNIQTFDFGTYFVTVHAMVKDGQIIGVKAYSSADGFQQVEYSYIIWDTQPEDLTFRVLFKYMVNTDQPSSPPAGQQHWWDHWSKDTIPDPTATLNSVKLKCEFKYFVRETDASSYHNGLTCINGFCPE